MNIGSTLIVMRGYPGTGKSTIAQALARVLHAPLIDRDVIRQVGVDILGDLPGVGHLSYELMFALAREQLKLGLTVIIDTPLTYRRTYDQARELAHTFSAPMLVVRCECSREVQERRLEGRKGKASEFQITSWEEWLRWRPRYEDFDDEGCIIDTSNALDVSTATVTSALRELHRGDDLYV